MSKIITHESRFRTLLVTDDIALLSSIIGVDSTFPIYAKAINFYNKGGTTATVRMDGDIEPSPGINIFTGNDITLQADENCGIGINGIGVVFTPVEDQVNSLEIVIEYHIEQK